MYITITLFFISLAGIIVMMLRKLILIRSGKITNIDEISFQIPYISEIKNTTTKNIKKYTYFTLVEIIRQYVRLENFSKLTYNKIKNKIKNIKINKNGHMVNALTENKEASKFLKMVSEYKQKIRKIKHQIKEEEEN